MQRPEDDYNAKEKWDAEIISFPVVQLVHYCIMIQFELDA